jgi:hypothetical protein
MERLTRFSLREVILCVALIGVLLAWYLDHLYLVRVGREVSWCYHVVANHLEDYADGKVTRGPTGLLIQCAECNAPDIPVLYRYEGRFLIPVENKSDEPMKWTGK